MVAEIPSRDLSGLPMPADLAATLRFDPDEGLIDLPATMAALSAQAGEAGFGIDRHAIANDLQAATFRQRAPAVVRLCVSPAGAVAIEVRAVADAGKPPL